MTQLANEKVIILQDVLTLVELVQTALPRLHFSDPDQALASNELLWLAGCVGAKYEASKLEEVKKDV